MVPIGFAQRMTTVYGVAGRMWAEGLPETLARVAARMGLEVEPPFLDLTYHYVAPATTAYGARCVLKIGFPGSERGREPIALSAYAGRGAARLERYDPELNAMLLERVEPGRDLRDVADPAAVEIASEVLRELWQAPIPEDLAELGQWTSSLERVHVAEGPLPKDLVVAAAGLRSELLVDPPQRVVVHGDLHHTNVLFSELRGWLAIDPKGLVGEKAFEVAPFLLNPWPVPVDRTWQRIETFVDRLGLDRARVVAWSFVQAVLSACWTVEDGEAGWERAIEFAREIRASAPTFDGPGSRPAEPLPHRVADRDGIEGEEEEEQKDEREGCAEHRQGGTHEAADEPEPCGGPMGLAPHPLASERPRGSDADPRVLLHPGEDGRKAQEEPENEGE